jgi:hypothetical protein
MRWLMNTNTTELWVVMLCVTAAIATLTVMGGFFFAWRKRSVVEEDPVPHCNFQERLAQIAATPMVQGRKLDSRDPVATAGRS